MAWGLLIIGTVSATVGFFVQPLGIGGLVFNQSYVSWPDALQSEAIGGGALV